MKALLSRLRKAASPAPLEPAVLTCGGRDIAVTFKRNAQARRLVLRLSSDGGGVVVTVPPRVSRSRALEFVERSAEWIETRLARVGISVAVEPGSRIPFRGIDHDVRAVPALRGTVMADPVAHTIHVPGGAAHGRRRTADWLKRAARDDLLLASRKYAALMDVTFSRVSIRDQRSRWGSCSSAGVLSYSWRLILAPPYVLDYVAAHEVAHLRHMDHSARFWRLVLTHCPDAVKAKRWLKTHGQSVHRFQI